MWRSLFILILILAALTGSVFWVYNKWQDRAARLEQYQQAQQAKFEEVSVTFIEGRTNEQFYQAAEKKGLGTVSYFTEQEQSFPRGDYDVLKSVPKDRNLLGFLFPDTYRFAKTGGEARVLPTLISTFTKKFNQAALGVPKEGDRFLPEGYNKLVLTQNSPGLTAFELVTLASIVEKETGQSGESIESERLLQERQTVAGIFYNRLLIGQPLESDATVNFVTGAGRAQPTLKDLETESKYNTYKYVGLPPGPIANVSYSSLYAVLRPIKTDYYYFLHKQPSGEVVYSKTYEEHLQNKYRYLK